MSLSLKSLILLAALCPLVGCSAFRPKEQQVRIDTDPTGLPVRVDGQDRGLSPITISLDRNVSHTIVASDTNRVYVRELHRKMSTTGKLDMMGGAMVLVPGLGLLTPGAWDLDSTDVLLPMGDVPTTAPAVAPMVSRAR